MNNKYKGVMLPNELMLEVDKYLKTNKKGYKSRAEVIKVAVREFLEKV